ncbi:MAG: sugar phosphate nucleotidyltransferase [Candidatus Aenigmatarchaeota archaeon]
MGSDYQLVILAGGKGTRLSHITKGMPKCLLEVEGKKLLDYCISCYPNIDEITLLLGYGYEKVMEYVEGEKRKGNPLYASKVVKYSIEKEKLLGKGGAIYNGLMNGSIDREKPYIIHYPDDLILEEDFEEKLRSKHEENTKKGAWLTMVVVLEIESPFGRPVINGDGFVRKFEEKPWVSLTTNVGVYYVQPEVNEFILKKRPPFNLESDLFGELCEMGKVASMVIDRENWVPVNDEKGLEKAIKKVKLNKNEI